MLARAIPYPVRVLVEVVETITLNELTGSLQGHPIKSGMDNMNIFIQIKRALYINNKQPCSILLNDGRPS